MKNHQHLPRRRKAQLGSTFLHTVDGQLDLVRTVWVGASSSKPAPEPYKVSNASQAIVLGELLSKRVDELDKLRSRLDDPGEDESREDLLNSIAVLERGRQEGHGQSSCLPEGEVKKASSEKT